MSIIAFLVYAGGVNALCERSDVSIWKAWWWPYYAAKKIVGGLDL